MTPESLEQYVARLRAERQAAEGRAIAFIQAGDVAAAQEHARTANALRLDIDRVLERLESWMLS